MATKALTHSCPSGARGRKVKFGDVTITAKAPSAKLVKENIRLSTQALERVAQRLAKPGVKLRARKGVPLFSLDSDDPEMMIRTLDDRTERGRVVDGVFQVTGDESRVVA